MRTIEAWVEELWRCLTRKSLEHRAIAIREEAVRWAAEQQRESDAKKAEHSPRCASPGYNCGFCEHRGCGYCKAANCIRANPLVKLSKEGE